MKDPLKKITNPMHPRYGESTKEYLKRRVKYLQQRRKKVDYRIQELEADRFDLDCDIHHLKEAIKSLNKTNA